MASELLNVREYIPEPDAEALENRVLAQTFTPQGLSQDYVPQPVSPYSQSAEENGDALATSMAFIAGQDDLAKTAQSVELSLKSGVDERFARDFPQLVSQKEAAKNIDFERMASEAETVTQALRYQGLIFGGAEHITELVREEKRLRSLNTRKPGQAMATANFDALDATFGATYQGIIDIADGLSMINKDFFTQAQQNLDTVDMAKLQADGVDTEIIEVLQSIAQEDFDAEGNFLPRPEWLETWEQRRQNASGVEGLVADVFRTLPNMGASILGAAVGGPVGAGLVSASLIYGQTLNQLAKDPQAKDTQRSREAALLSAVLQAPLEALGAQSLFAALRPKTSFGKAIKAWGLGAVSEFGTEYAQSYPEAFATEYARGLNPLEQEDLKEFWNLISSSDFQSDAAYQGLVGFFAGGTVGAVGIGANRKRYAQQTANIANSLDIAQKLPETYKQILMAHVEQGNVEKEIYMPAETVNTLFQSEESIEQDKIDFLQDAGIDRANFESALATGADIAVPFENIHKVLARDTEEKTLFQSIKMTPRQESAIAVSGAQTQVAELVASQPTPEELAALETLMQESVLDPEAEKRLALRQQVVDDIIEASKNTDNPYTAAQANAYADIIDARALTWGQIFGRSPLDWYESVAPIFKDGGKGPIITQRTLYSEVLPDVFGHAYEEYAGKIEEGLEKLLAVRSGYIPSAIDVEGIGTIDIPWGEDGPKGWGLAHILERRKEQGLDAEEFVREIPKLLREGKVNPQDKGRGRLYVEDKKTKAVIRLDWNGQDRVWLVTSYRKYPNQGASAGLHTSDQAFATEQNIPSMDPLKETESILPQASVESNPLIQEGKGKPTYRAAITFREDARAIISFFKAANVTSAGHEIGHLLRRDLEAAATMEDAPDWLKQDWKAANDFVGAQMGQAWTEAQEEQFADAFTNFLDTAKAPSQKLTRAFRKLRQWFTSLYKHVMRRGFDPSPEMAKVFTRLLAVENEIASAKTGASVTPMVLPSDAPENFQQSYIAALQDAEAATASAIEVKMLRELRKERAVWRREAKDAANTDPRQVRLDELVKAGGMQVDAAIAERYGKDTMSAIRSRRIGAKLLVKEGGVVPEILAEQYGFTGPNAVDSLFAYLEDVPTKKELQDAYVAQKTVEWEQSWQAEELVLTEELADMLEVEAHILADGIGVTVTDGAALRKAVARNLALMEMDKLESQIEGLKETMRQRSDDARNRYSARMKRRKNESQAAYQKRIAKLKERHAARVEKKQNETREIYERRLALGRDALANEALAAKERQRRAVEELRQRYQAKAIREKLFRRVQRMARVKSDKVDFAYAEQMRALAQKFGIVGKSGGPHDPANMPSLQKFITAQQPDFAMDIPVPEWILTMAERDGNASWKKLTLQQFEELADFISWLDHQARDKNFWRVEGEKIEIALASKEMADKMQGLKSKKAIADYERKKLWGGTKQFSQELLADITSMEWALNAADGHLLGTKILEGPCDKYILQPLYKARADELALYKEVIGKLDAILQPLRQQKNTDKRWALPDVPLPEDVQVEWGAKPWSYEKVLMVALNMGNDGNKNALMKGFGWTEEDLQAITSSLTASDWKMVQDILDLVNSLYPHVNGAYERVNGVPMKKVEASPIEIPFGKLAGGYFPLVFDHELSKRAATMIEEDLFQNHQAAVFMKASPASGFTKERKGGTLPPRLAMSVLTQHISQSIHYASHAEAIRAVGKIIKSEPFTQAFTDKFGKPMYQQLNPWLRHIARPDTQNVTRFEKIAEMARHMATIQALGLKFTTAAMQLTSLTNSVQEIGAPYMARGLAYVASKRGQAIEDVKSLSPMMQGRAQSLDRDLAANLNKYDPDRKVLRWEWKGEQYEASRQDVEAATFVPMQLMDSIVATATWYGAYQKGMKDYSGNEKKSAAFADRAVIRAQAAGHPINLTAMQRAGGMRRFMTMFMTFTMNLQNKTRFYASGLREGNISTAEYVRHLFNDLILPTVANTAMMGLLKSGDIPDEPEEYVKDLGYYVLGGYPLARDAGSFIEYGISPGFTNSLVNRGLSDPFTAGKRAYELVSNDQKRGDEWEKFLKSSMDAMGFWMGVPTRPVWQFIDGARDIYAGTTANPLRLFVKEQKKD